MSSRFFMPLTLQHPAPAVGTGGALALGGLPVNRPYVNPFGRAVRYSIGSCPAAGLDSKSRWLSTTASATSMTLRLFC
jgi:hypothetical protein